MTEPTPWRYAARYDPEAEREIRLVAAREVTGDQVAAAGSGVSPEIARLWLAEEVVQRRIETREKLRKAERQQRQQHPQQPQVAPGGRHPSAEKWAKWGKSADFSDGSPKCQTFIKQWERKRAPIRVYRAELPDEAVSSISDCRKVYRDAQIECDFIRAMLLFMFDETVRVVGALKARVAELEARKMPEYKGIWQEDTHYQQGSMVTHHGSVWFAQKNTVGTPGNAPDWQLAVKRGRDGRHGKDAT